MATLSAADGESGQAPAPTSPGGVSPPSGVATESAAGPQLEAATLKREAVVLAAQVAQAYPDDAFTHALLGSAYYNTGRADEAAKHLKRCLELNPELAEAYDMLAKVAYEKGKPEEAERLCREALKRGPANPEVLNRLGRSLMDLGRTEEAVTTLQQATRLPRPMSESWYLLGQALLQLGEPAKAKESFQQAVTLLPDHTQAFFGLYTACMRLGQAEEAARYREKFQSLEAVDRRTLTDRNSRQDELTGLPLVRQTVARTLFGAGQVYRLHKEAGKAAELFLKSASLDPDNQAYRAVLEAHFVQANNLAEGVNVFTRLAADQPQSALNQLYLGRLQARSQQVEAAEKAYRKAQQLAPQWAEGYRALAELYLRANRQPEEARTLARKAVELEPSAPNHYMLAVACVKNRDREGALAAVKKAIDLSPSEKRYQELLQQLSAAP